MPAKVPLTLEKLSPVLSYFEADGWEAGCLRCIEVLQYGGLGHTLCLHTQDLEVVRQFALKKPVFRILINTPGTHGAIGYTTNLPPSMTLGCGALGNNITSDNITPLHLIDRKRVAFETRPATDERAVPLQPLLRPADGIEEAARRFVAQKLGSAAPSQRAGANANATPPRPVEGPADFVSEADVRAALRENRKIRIHAKTLLTPSARDLGEQHRVFEKS